MHPDLGLIEQFELALAGDGEAQFLLEQVPGASAVCGVHASISKEADGTHGRRPWRDTGPRSALAQQGGDAVCPSVGCERDADS